MSMTARSKRLGTSPSLSGFQKQQRVIELRRFFGPQTIYPCSRDPKAVKFSPPTIAPVLETLLRLEGP